MSRLVPALGQLPASASGDVEETPVMALLLFLGLVLVTVLLGFLAAVQGGLRGVATLNAPRRLVELRRRAPEQSPPDTLASI